MTMKLKDLAKITTGYHFRGKIEHNPHGNVSLIQIKDLDEDFVLRSEELQRVRVDKPQPYLVRQRDVLFTGRGYRLGATEIKEPLDDTVPAGSFFVMRARSDAELLPAYLAWSLNSSKVQAQLRRAEQGSALPLVRRADLEEVEIAVPPLAIQHAIVKLDECVKREKRLLEELQCRRALLAEAIALRAIENTSQPNR